MATPGADDAPVRQRGSASAEQAGLIALVAGLILASVALLADRGGPSGAEAVGEAIARKIACAPQMKAPCRQDPLTEAYGRPLAGVARALAPPVEALPGPDGQGLVGVDFRRCRRASCAVPLPGVSGERLTASNRRTTTFVAVRDERASGRGVGIDYWTYRPTMGWRVDEVRPTAEQLTGLARTPLLESSSPRLVPLETLPGRNHFEFRNGEQPPWRWSIVG